MLDIIIKHTVDAINSLPYYCKYTPVNFWTFENNFNPKMTTLELQLKYYYYCLITYNAGGEGTTQNIIFASIVRPSHNWIAWWMGI